MDIATFILTEVNNASTNYIQSAFIALAGYTSRIATSLLTMVVIMVSILWIKRMFNPNFSDLLWKFIKIVCIVEITGHYAYYSIFVEIITKMPAEVAGELLSSVGTYDVTSINQLLGNFIMSGFKEATVQFTSFRMGAGIIIGVIIILGTIIGGIGLLFISTLSIIMLSVLLGFGPIFLWLWAFDSLGKMSEAWLQQVMNYALVPMFAYAISLVTLPMAFSALTSKGWGSDFGMAGVFSFRVNNKCSSNETSGEYHCLNSRWNSNIR